MDETFGMSRKIGLVSSKGPQSSLTHAFVLVEGKLAPPSRLETYGGATTLDNVNGVEFLKVVQFED